MFFWGCMLYRLFYFKIWLSQCHFPSLFYIGLVYCSAIFLCSLDNVDLDRVCSNSSRHTKPLQATFFIEIFLSFFRKILCLSLRNTFHNLCRTSAGLPCLALLAAQDKLSGEREGEEGSPLHQSAAVCRLQRAAFSIFNFFLGIVKHHCQSKM